ncbi:MAG: replicative DNA helicase [Clostridiaceae bacterium]|jgi:replicative DNA helicase|nr:replicative DNA helicase [Clostridiales bacterium]MDD4138886.1 replicative DNA helicase [Eubacteriales bacterium]MDD4743560.1 replicative DNA helicase [Eubacteriales bacterium]NLB46044.1 replicative DNA helicase [Clostridiaceae bacterium]
MAPDETKKAAGALVPPSNQQAEQSVLGCALSGERPLAEITAMLKTEDLYRPQHRLIYDAICTLYMDSKPVDIITVSDMLENRGQLEQAGGLSYISSLPDAAPLVSNAAHYADLVRQKAILRRLISTMQEISGLCYNDPDDADLLLDVAAKRIYEIRENRDISGFESIKEIMGRTVNELAAIARGQPRQKLVLTGFSQLDRILGGLRPGGLIIVAARPAMGKSAFALNIAQKAATLHHVPAAIFSLEMSKEEISNRLLSSQSLVNARSLSSGELLPEDWEKIARALPPLYASPIYIDDRSGTSVMEMMSKCRQLKLENKLGLVIVDYLQLMNASQSRTESRQQEISEISRTLKIMARELSVPVIALSQLSRACEMRSEKKPLLSDLRDSGAIEQDADVVIFLYREKYYATEQAVTETEDAEIIIAKNRQGATGSMQLGWWPKYTLFFEKDDGRIPSEPPPYSA